MSTTVDQRVVEMRFDNKQFESNVSTTMSTLSKLKQSLNLKGAVQGLEEVNNVSKRCDLSVLSNAIETVKYKFSALQVMGITALANITNSAVNAGKRIVEALTIDPIKTGLQEYETQINSVQTILANTQSKGTTLEQVNAALDELNTYADKTIYNFTEMTRNIGTFTAAGIDLKTSTTAIQGIANLAAVSGSTSQQASVAMYQLSQALAAGTVKLMDWNSVVNAGMGGQVFQEALKKTARAHGVAVDEMIKKNGSFRESLQEGWITSEILTETLGKMTKSGAAEYLSKLTGVSYTQIEAAQELAAANKGSSDSYKELVEQLASTGKITAEEALEILQLADTAEDAATKVKTFTQLWDTLKEAAQSGWTQSWELIIGDFEEAKDLLTEISDSVSAIIGSSADSRNALLMSGLSTGWKQLLNEGVSDSELFKETVIGVAKDHGISIDEMIKNSGTFEKTLREGWITSDILAESISSMTEKMQGFSDEELRNHGYTAAQVASMVKLNEAVQNGTIDLEEYAKKMAIASGRENIIQGFRNVASTVASIVKTMTEGFREIIPPMTGERLYNLTVRFKEFTEKLKLSDEAIANLKSTFRGLGAVVHIISSAISSVFKIIMGLLPGVSSLGGGILSMTGSFGEWLVKLDEAITKSGFFNAAAENILSFLKSIGSGFKSALSGLSGFGDTLSAIGGKIKNVLTEIWEAFKTVFGYITENISIGDIFAGLVGTGAIVALKKLSSVFETVKGVFGGGIMGLIFGKGDGSSEKPEGMLDKIRGILDGVRDSLQAFTTGIKVSSLVSIAIAIGILSASLRAIAGLEVQDVVKGLAAMAGMFTMLYIAFESISKTLATYNPVGIVKTGIALVLIASAIKVLSDAMVKMSDLNFPEIVKGLIGIGGAMIVLSASLKIIGETRIPLSTSVAILALAGSCKILVDAVGKFGEMSWGTITHGLVAMGGALAELTAVISVMGKVGGFKSLAGSVSLLITIQSLGELANSLKKFGEMSWSVIKHGLVGMGGALGEVASITGALGYLAGAKSLLGAGSIFITVQSLGDLADAFKKFGEMSWDAIQRGIVGLGYALGEVASITGALGYLTGFSGILGSGAIFITVQSLGDLADAFKKFADISWDGIQRGLVGLGGALGEVATITGALGYLTGFSGILGSGAILITVQSLGDLADAFKKFSNISWEGIQRGLVGLGGALGEVATITGALGYLAGLKSILGAGAILIAVQSLGDLADAFKKFGEMSWEEIGRGLVGMGGALGEVAVISGALGSLAGLPALLGGGAILLAVQGLGDLADALKKFGEMSWDEIGRGLTAMGSALGEVALGSILNTLSGIGAAGISTVAYSLGVLADSVKKWKDVVVPENLGLQLGVLASGIMAFTFDGFGAAALSEAAPAVGTMADSVKKWSDVVVPENLGEQLAILASGVQSFTLGGFGASAISEVAPAIGTLADSVKKWVDVVIPENLNEQLKSLSEGVESFTWAFAGGWSIATVAEPLGDLAVNARKWNNVSIPEDIKDGLKSLAEGIEAFTWAFAGGWSLGAVTEPLGNLADSVTKWNGVNIPSELGPQLTSLADGVKAFNGVTNLSSISTSFGDLATSISKLSAINFSSITTGLTDFVDTTSGLASSSGSFSTLGTNILNGIVTPLQNGSAKLSNAVKNLINGAVNSIKTSSLEMGAAGKVMMQNLSKGIQSGSTLVSSSTKKVVSQAKISAGSGSSSFWNIGYNLADSFARGISSGSYLASIRARAMAQAAVRAAKEALAINSPSKVFRKIGTYVPEGFAQGITKLGSMVAGSSREMASRAIEGTKSAISQISNIIDSDIDSQPTIRPVLDLSNIRSGASAIGSLMDFNTALNLDSISYMNSSRSKYGQNGDIVNAIEKLGKAIGNLENTSYNINGITYDSSSELEGAMETIIRAARIERRS